MNAERPGQRRRVAWSGRADRCGPESTISGTELTAVATTGIPHIIASTTAQGRPSYRLDIAKTSSARQQRCDVDALAGEQKPVLQAGCGRSPAPSSPAGHRRRSRRRGCRAVEAARSPAPCRAAPSARSSLAAVPDHGRSCGTPSSRGGPAPRFRVARGCRPVTGSSIARIRLRRRQARACTASAATIVPVGQEVVREARQPPFDGEQRRGARRSTGTRWNGNPWNEWTIAGMPGRRRPTGRAPRPLRCGCEPVEVAGLEERRAAPGSPACPPRGTRPGRSPCAAAAPRSCRQPLRRPSADRPQPRRSSSGSGPGAGREPRAV